MIPNAYLKIRAWVVRHIQQSYVRTHLRSAGFHEKLCERADYRAGEYQQKRSHRAGPIC